MNVLDRLAGGLIVSCQAKPGHPLRSPAIIARLAECAVLGGAVGVRVNSPQDVQAVRAVVGDLPIIGLHKVPAPDRDVITPRFELAQGLAAAGADVIAFEATGRAEHPVAAFTARVQAELGLPVMADVATPAQGYAAWEAGAEIVGSTLSGYTPDSPQQDDPDLDLVQALSAYGARTIAEGRLVTAAHVRDAFAAGAFAVVVGTAVTDPAAITRRLAAATPAHVVGTP